LVEAGALPVGLGSNRLRTETAAVALLSALMLWQAGGNLFDNRELPHR
jgi:16S rRNA U1498 N3-methylase RsmE